MDHNGKMRFLFSTNSCTKFHQNPSSHPNIQTFTLIMYLTEILPIHALAQKDTHSNPIYTLYVVEVQNIACRPRKTATNITIVNGRIRACWHITTHWGYTSFKSHACSILLKIDMEKKWQNKQVLHFHKGRALGKRSDLSGLIIDVNQRSIVAN